MDSSEGLDQFRKDDIVTTTPLLKDLSEYVTPKYAVHWKLIGTQLGLSNDMLDIIEEDYRFITSRCNAMFNHWLELDINASWKNIFSVIESSAMFKARVLYKGTDTKDVKVTIENAVSLLAKRVGQVSVQRRLMLDEKMWPPQQSKSFTPLLLIQYQRQKTSEEHIALINLIKTGNIGNITSAKAKYPKLKEIPSSRHTELMVENHETLQNFFDTSTITKDVAAILLPFDKSNEPCFILIEGPPGIGKSLFLKEIAYRWGKKQVLKSFKLVLLVCLRYPIVQNAKSVNELLQLFCEGDLKATEIATACSDYFLDNGGKDLLFLFDGLDEFSKNLQNDSLIGKILKRQILPNCGLIVSTRPHVSAYHRDQATYKVDILGFTEAERNDYIQNALKGLPNKIEELTTYLNRHTTISSLCFVPYNMVVLLYLCKQGVKLPENFVDLYNYFVYLTICHHLAKDGHHLTNTITDITNLPEPYNRVIKQLSKFSLETLNRQKLIFTLDEIKVACPDISDIPGAINGFGLLQAVQDFGLTGLTMNFNFVHYSVQEFLAAHYIAHLPQRDQLQALHGVNRNIDILFLYIAIKGKKGFSYKLFLSGGNRKIAISEEFLTDQLQSLRLYHCFHEIENEEICTSIEKAIVFNNNKINLRHFKLTAYDVRCIALFIMSSFHKEWNELCLDGCYIQDHGIRILQCIGDIDVKVTSLKLDNNGLTTSSSSVIVDITNNCKVEWLSIAGNSSIGEDSFLYSILSSPSSVLKELYMQRTDLSSNAAKYLFIALQAGTKLEVLNVMSNKITDDACQAIVDAIKINTSLVTLKCSVIQLVNNLFSVF